MSPMWSSLQHRRLLIALTAFLLVALVLTASVAADPGGPPATPVSEPPTSDVDERSGPAPAAIPPNYGLHNQRIPGAAFRPARSSYWYETTYDGACIYASTTGLLETFAELQLPDGAIISYVRFFYRDASPVGNMAFSLTELNDTGWGVALASLESSGSGGLGSIGASLEYPVDSFSHPLVLRYAATSTIEGDMKFCGARVQYYAPAILTAFMPYTSRQSTAE